MYTIEDSIRDEAREEARVEFREEFREEYQREIARKMLACGCALDLIEKITGLSPQVIEELSKELMPPPSSTVQSAHLQPA